MGLKTKVSRVFKHLSTPLLPDDYTHLLNPLWSSRELRGQIEAINPTSPTSAELIIRPGWGMPTDFKPGQFIGLSKNILILIEFLFLLVSAASSKPNVECPPNWLLPSIPTPY